MVVNHSIDPLDRVPISEVRSMVASTKGSVNGPSAHEPFDQLMDQTPGCLRDLRGSGGGRCAWMVVPTGRRWRRSGNSVPSCRRVCRRFGASVSTFRRTVAARAKVAALARGLFEIQLIPVSVPDLSHILEGREAAQSFRKTVDLAQQHAERLFDPTRLFAQREPTCKSDYGKKTDFKIRLPRKAKWKALGGDKLRIIKSCVRIEAGCCLRYPVKSRESCRSINRCLFI